MIPTIEDILMYFKNGDCTIEKAVSWIEQHQENADLRDHFAGLAMQGLIAQSMGTALSSTSKIGAEYAYSQADAMLKARKP